MQFPVHINKQLDRKRKLCCPTFLLSDPAGIQTQDLQNFFLASFG